MALTSDLSLIRCPCGRLMADCVADRYGICPERVVGEDVAPAEPRGSDRPPPVLAMVPRTLTPHQESVIRALEAALEQAREGRVSSIALALVRPDGAVNYSYSTTDQVGALMGSVANLLARLTRGDP